MYLVFVGECSHLLACWFSAQECPGLVWPELELEAWNSTQLSPFGWQQPNDTQGLPGSEGNGDWSQNVELNQVL